MNINVRLNKNFVTNYNKMLDDYGEEIAKINGFSDQQLSYTDFISNFIDTDTVADASVDGNANVGQKDIVTLINEMPKPHQKLLAFNKIYYEINKKYGFKTANDWLRAEWDGHLYLHDANTSSFVHYCYKGEEMLTVKYNDKIYNISFASLYNLIKDEEEYDITINCPVKFPHNLFVLDIKDEQQVWTKVNRLVAHSNSKPMRFIKYANGLSQIVTEDHPIITEDGDVPAKEVTTEHRVFTTIPYVLNTIPEYPAFMTNEFGWLVGMCLAEGSAQPSCITIKQKENEQYNKILHILNKFNIPFSLDDDNRIRIKASPLEKFIEKMILGKTSAFKVLPEDYLDYPSDFMNGVVAGLIDGDGTIGGYKNRQCQIRITSETLCHQISDYLKRYDVFCGDRTPHIYKSNSSFEQKLPLFGIAFTLTNEEYFSKINSIKINNKYIPLERKGDFKNKKYQYNYGWVNIIENTEYIDSCPIVYDITTETGHFICNNVLSHNCFAYDLKDLAEKGLFFIDNFNAEPPRHLETFVDFVKEFVSWTCNRSSGEFYAPVCFFSANQQGRICG
jgi:intein/homing endonuclease